MPEQRLPHSYLSLVSGAGRPIRWTEADRDQRPATSSTTQFVSIRFLFLSFHSWSICIKIPCELRRYCLNQNPYCFCLLLRIYPGDKKFMLKTSFFLQCIRVRNVLFVLFVCLYDGRTIWSSVNKGIHKRMACVFNRCEMHLSSRNIERAKNWIKYPSKTQYFFLRFFLHLSIINSENKVFNEE